MRIPSEFLGRPIYSLQTMLRKISDKDPDVLPLIPDGRFGPHTFASVRSFQKQYNLSDTGVVDLETWEAIVETYRNTRFSEWDISISRGGYHPVISEVQSMLFSLSDQFHEIQRPQLTGALDEITQNGLQFIQKASGLDETGLPDQSTLIYLQKLYGHYYINKLPLN